VATTEKIMTTHHPIGSTLLERGSTAANVRLAGLAAIVAGVVHFTYLAVLTGFFTVGADGLFPAGTLAFRVDGVVSTLILGLYLAGLVGLHVRERGGYGAIGHGAFAAIAIGYAVTMLLWATMAATGTTTIAGVDGGSLVVMTATMFVLLGGLFAYAVVLWRRTTVTRVGLAALALALPVGLPLSIALEPSLGEWSYLPVVALIAGGWIAVGFDLRSGGSKRSTEAPNPASDSLERI
jgi:hypothetical protein